MELLTPEAFERLESLGERAQLRVREALSGAGVSGQVTGAGSLLRIHSSTAAS